jgi:hypothetical protein
MGMTSAVYAQAGGTATKPAPAASQPKKEAAPAKKGEAMDSEKAMQDAWEKAGEPGPYHTWLKQFEGDWEAAVKEFKPDGTASESKATYEQKMIFGGRFLEGSFKGRMMGKFFYGRSLMGYNNTDKRFESAWADSMSSTVAYSTGTADSAGKVLTMKGECTDPMSNQKMTTREVTTINDKNSYKMEFYGTQGGKEMKMMEISFTRESGEKKHEDKDAKKDDKDAKKDHK